MGNKGRSERGFGGSINHYDEHGKKVGRSDPSFFGGYNNYDAKGKKIGHSDPAFFGGMNHYDNKGNKVGHSDPNGLGGFTHYDSKGNKTGRTDETFPGSYSHSDGCYVATCVYGSYDCPEVWALRRFRDDTLGRSILGRLFIYTYYAISPGVVKVFGKKEAFRKLWKRQLDFLVARLCKNGVDNTPYVDKDWRKRI